MAFGLSGILSLDNSGFMKGISQAKSASDSLSQKSLTASGAVKGIFGAAAKIAGVVGITKMAKDSLMLASNLTEVQNVVDTTFGSASKQIDNFAKSASKSFGISELQAKQFNGVLGSMMKSSGITGNKLVDMSKGLTGLAGDMASFYNLRPEEAFEKLKSAIGGETKLLVPMLKIA